MNEVGLSQVWIVKRMACNYGQCMAIDKWEHKAFVADAKSDIKDTLSFASSLSECSGCDIIAQTLESRLKEGK